MKIQLSDHSVFDDTGRSQLYVRNRRRSAYCNDDGDGRDRPVPDREAEAVPVLIYTGIKLYRVVSVHQIEIKVGKQRFLERNDPEQCDAA